MEGNGMSKTPPMPDRTWAWQFHPNSAWLEAMRGGWLEREGNNMTPYLLATPLREAAPDLLEAHEENARILGFLVNELQGLIPAGKLAALDKCYARSVEAIAKAKGGAE